MEQRRLQITRRTSNAAREIIADLIKKAVVNIRGEYPDEILKIVNNFSFDKSHIPEGGLNIECLFRDRNINNLLELIYIDLLIQYRDIFDAQDHLRNIKRSFEASINTNVIKAAEIMSRAGEYRELSLRRFEYTDILHESFNSARNMTLSDYPLVVNNGSGILKLQGTIEEYAKPATSDVFLNVQSNDVLTIDESSSSSAYKDDMTDPYFITMAATDFPDNDITREYDFTSYDGVIVDLVIRFNTTQPVTRVSFVPFSNKSVDIPQVYYSNVVNADWDSGDFKYIKDIDIAYDTNTVEINFERVYAREVHVIIHQEAYNLARSDVEIEETLSASDYVTTVADNMKDILPGGFLEPINLNMQMTELVNDVRDKASVETTKLAPNTKVYSVGLCSLEVSNVSYSHFGEYLDSPRKLNGNLHSMSYVQTDNMEEMEELTTSGIIDMCTLMFVNAGENSIYMGETTDDGKAIDGAVIEPNLEYSEGTTVRSTTVPYKLTTHFLPTDEFTGFRMFADGEELTLPGTEEKEVSDYNATISFPASFAEENNLLEGTIVTMVYNTPSYDYFGNSYSVGSANMENRIGKPNIAVNSASNIDDNFLYVPLSASGAISYAEDEYTKVMISGEIFYQTSEDKGLEIDGETILSNGSSYYIHNSAAGGPFSSFYYGSLREVPEVTLSGETNEFVTEVPYMKGTLTVYSEGKLVTSVTEYATDTVGTIVGDEGKREFSIPGTYDPSGITVCYVPVYPEATTDYIGSNIAQYNATEKFTKTTDMKISLANHPHIDSDIVSSDLFNFSDGAFYLKWKYSVVYEPIAVYINGIKAVNITKYREDILAKPSFGKSYREDDYQFYVENGNTLVFNKDIAGTILVYYYKFIDTIQTGIEMYRSNYNRDDLSPEIYSYTLLENIQV